MRKQVRYAAQHEVKKGVFWALDMTIYVISLQK